MAKRYKGLSKKHASRAANLLQKALAFQQSGYLQEAETLYQTILKKYPNHPDAMHFLGVIAHQTGKNDLAIIHYKRALAIKPDNAEIHNNLGLVLVELGRLEEAIAHYEQALAITHDYAEAHYNMGLVLEVLGRQEDAIARYEKALIIKPDFVEAHNNLGITLETLGHAEEAIACYKRAISIKPDYAEAHNNMGNVLKELGRHKDTIACYKQAISIKPDYVGAHINLGTVLQSLGQAEDSIMHYRQAISIKPDYAEAHIKLGNLYRAMGRKEESAVCYERALTINPDCSGAQYNLSIVKPNQEQIPIIEKELKKPTVSEKEAINYHFALGYIFNNVKSYDKAFEHCHKANTLKRKMITYDAQSHSNYVDSLIKYYSKNHFQKMTAYGSKSELPVFIVGMPRSGTTLVEQIVSCHPQVYGADELHILRRIEKTITKQYEPSRSYPECMSLCDKSTALNLSAEYLEELTSYSSGATRITDKMPNNFLRIGLIKTLFPKARIIHCRRNAIDTCASIYLNYFIYGNLYSSDLYELGRYYQDYIRLMNHWRRLFSSEIFDVQYEELVMDQESVSRQLIEYIGLDWDEKCLDFYKNKRVTNTISNLQVRQPIYKNSINRWKHYENHLEPLTAILKPLI